MRIFDWFAILHPRYWFLNYRYSAEWDAKLNEIMLVHKFTKIERHTARLGPYEVWISNHPYASFTPYPDQFGIRPSRVTLYKAWCKFINEAGSEEHALTEYFKQVEER